MEDAFDIANSMTYFGTAGMFGVLTVVMRITYMPIKHDVSPQMSILWVMLYHAFNHLVAFSIVFGLMLFAFAFLANMLFGYVVVGVLLYDYREIMCVYVLQVVIRRTLI